MTRGLFIVVDGIPRAGVTTQSLRLCNELNARGMRAVCLEFPNYTSPSGQLLRAVMQTSGDAIDPHTRQLLMTANRAELTRQICKQLAEGTTVVCDRYMQSASAVASAQGVSIQWSRAVDSIMLRPDVAFYLDITSDYSQWRSVFSEPCDSTLFLDNVKAGFDALLTINRPWTTRIDGTQKRDAIAEQIVNRVELIKKAVIECDEPMSTLADTTELILCARDAPLVD